MSKTAGCCMPRTIQSSAVLFVISIYSPSQVLTRRYSNKKIKINNLHANVRHTHYNRAIIFKDACTRERPVGQSRCYLTLAAQVTGLNTVTRRHAFMRYVMTRMNFEIYGI